MDNQIEELPIEVKPLENYLLYIKFIIWLNLYFFLELK